MLPFISSPKYATCRQRNNSLLAIFPLCIQIPLYCTVPCCKSRPPSQPRTVQQQDNYLPVIVLILVTCVRLFGFCSVFDYRSATSCLTGGLRGPLGELSLCCLDRDCRVMNDLSWMLSYFFKHISSIQLYLSFLATNCTRITGTCSEPDRWRVRVICFSSSVIVVQCCVLDASVHDCTESLP